MFRDVASCDVFQLLTVHPRQQIARIAPVSREQILSYLAERVLGLPKSY